MPPPAGSLLKLFTRHVNVMRRAEIGLELAGDAGRHVAGRGGDRRPARRRGHACGARGLSLGGGSNEIQRNIISERVLGLPREYAADREVPYRDVKRGPTR